MHLTKNPYTEYANRQKRITILTQLKKEWAYWRTAKELRDKPGMSVRMRTITNLQKELNKLPGSSKPSTS